MHLQMKRLAVELALCALLIAAVIGLFLIYPFVPTH
jgi:hypothetical protein